MGFRGGGYHESEQEKRERKIREELSEWEGDEHLTLSEQDEQEISRLMSTTPQRVFYIIVGSVFLLLLIVGILGANVFHFW